MNRGGRTARTPANGCNIKKFPLIFHCVARKRPFQPPLSHRFGPKPARLPFLVENTTRLLFRPVTTRIQSLQKMAYQKLGRVRLWGIDLAV